LSRLVPQFDSDPKTVKRPMQARWLGLTVSF